jgi:hypothetical protein
MRGETMGKSAKAVRIERVRSAARTAAKAQIAVRHNRERIERAKASKR